MLHFFPTFSNDASDSPFAIELRRLGVPHKLFAAKLTFRYHSRIWLALVGWPKLAGFAVRSAVRSLVLSRPKPTAAIVGSHLEVLAFATAQAIGFSRATRIILLGFIFTQRRSDLINALRRGYFRFVFRHADTAIYHSELEARNYRALFKGCRTRFVYMPYGMHVAGSDESPRGAKSDKARPYILSAGRSGRDYGTLFAAVNGLDVDVHIVCDRDAALAGLKIPDNVAVLRNCYDRDYMDQLRNCLFVVVPLSVHDISAGQMVLLQAMAFEKASIVSKTETIEEYVREGVESLLVEQGNVSALRDAIHRLLQHEPLMARLAINGRRSFEEKFSMAAYVRQLVAAVG